MKLCTASIILALPLFSSITIAANIEEVFVTAQMRDESIQSVPIALSLIDSSELEKFHATSLTDIESLVPNVNFGRGGRSTRGEIAIRGVGDFSRNIGSDARVAVYLDGVPTGRSFSFDQDLGDIKSIEILRGPQGTLFGANTISGAISITTQEPTDEYSTSLFTEAGNYNLRKTKLVTNLPVMEKLYARFGYSVVDQDGFINNKLQGKDLQGFNRKTGFFKLRYLPTDNLELALNLHGLDESGDKTNAVALPGAAFGAYDLVPDEREVRHDAAEFEEREMYGASATVQYTTPNNYKILYIGGHRDDKFSEASEEDYSSLFIAVSYNNEKVTQTSHEIRLISPEFDHFDYVAGLFYSDQKVTTERAALTGPFFPNPNTSVSTPGQVNVKSSSFYAHGNYTPTDKLTLTAGIRYIREDKDLLYNIEDTTGLFINFDGLTDSISFSEVTPKAGISYDITDSSMAYFSVSKGFKGGGWNADLITSLEGFEFKPETAISYEAGLKNDFKFGSLRAAAFITKFKDFQVFQFVVIPEGGTLFSLTNAGEVTTKGLEIDGQVNFTEELSLSISASYTRAEFDKFRDGGGTGIHFDGNDLPYSPHLSYFLSLDYHHEINNSVEFNSNINYSYSGEFYSNPNNFESNKIDSHYNVGGSVGLDFYERVKLQIWVKNLTDETYLRQRTRSFLGQPRGYYEPPRSYGVSIALDI